MLGSKLKISEIVRIFCFLFFVFFIAFFSGNEAHSQNDSRTACFARSYLKPSYETYQEQTLARFESTQRLIEGYKGMILLQNIFRKFYKNYNPRDVFCIIGGDVDANTLRPALSTDGGTLFLFAPSDVDLELVLEATDTIDGKSVANELSHAVEMSRWPASIEKGCSWNSKGPRSKGPREVGIGSPEFKCITENSKLLWNLRKKLAAEVASYRAPSPGTIEIFRFPRMDDHGARESSSDAVSTYVYNILSRELIMEPLYNPDPSASGSFVVKGFKNTEALKSVAQWVAGIFEEALVGITLLTASETLKVLSTGDIITLPKTAATLKRSIYPDFVSSDLTNHLDTVIADFVCKSDYSEVMQLNTNERFWFNINSFRKAICGVTRSADKNLFYSPVSLNMSPTDIRAALKSADDKNLALRLERKLNELSLVQIDQSKLLNDIRETGYRRYFDARLSLLQEKLKTAEEAAREKNPLEVVATLGQVIADINKFGGSVGGLSSVWAGIPAASSKEQTKYLWSKRDTLGKVGSDFGSSAQGIRKGIKKIETWLDRRQQRTAVKQLKKALAELDAEYRTILREVIARRGKYRRRIDIIHNELNGIVVEREATKRAVASNAADIVMLNLLAYIATPGGQGAIEQCHRAIILNSANPEINRLQLTIGCLQNTPGVTRRLTCLQEQNTKSNFDTVIMSGGVGAIIWPKDARRCFK